MVCGQPHVKRVLQSQIKKKDLVHAYLFTGPAGTGKTTVARILAAMINAKDGMTLTPKLDDPFVAQIWSGKSGTDVYEMDAASNRGIDDIKDIREKAYYVPMEMRKRVYIIDECHMLTREAWNALLKLLEEPPAHAIFILCTTDDQKVIDTVHTRCMKLPFRSLTLEEVFQYLKPICMTEGISIADEAIRQLAITSKGSIRDALSKLENLKHNEGTITAAIASEQLGVPARQMAIAFIDAAISGGFIAALKSSSPCISTGTKPEDFYSKLAEVCHDMLICKAKGYDLSIKGYTPEEIIQINELQDKLSTIVGSNIHRLIRRWIGEMQQCAELTIYNTQPQFQVDVLFISLKIELKAFQQALDETKTKGG